MTVKDLIELLEKFPEDYNVVFSDGAEVWLKLDTSEKKVILTTGLK